MQGCVAPSEVPGIESAESSRFGALAEALIYADFATKYPRIGTEVFQDANNPAAYSYFLRVNNPRFGEKKLLDFHTRLRHSDLFYVPDFLVHTGTEKAFYEVKPDSVTGRSAGITKVGTLRATYVFYGLPYVAGTVFTPRDITVASLAGQINVVLRAHRANPGLILYKLCVDTNSTLELATLLALLAYIIREMNKQARASDFRPIDLAPALRSDQALSELARTLSIATGAAAAATVGWKYFWRAVAKRFAVRATTAAAIAAADGPLPVGDLIAAGMTIWTVIDIVRLSDELWRDARNIARIES